MDYGAESIFDVFLPQHHHGRVAFECAHKAGLEVGHLDDHALVPAAQGGCHETRVFVQRGEGVRDDLELAADLENLSVFARFAQRVQDPGQVECGLAGSIMDPLPNLGVSGQHVLGHCFDLGHVLRGLWSLATWYLA